MGICCYHCHVPDYLEVKYCKTKKSNFIKLRIKLPRDFGDQLPLISNVKNRKKQLLQKFVPQEMLYEYYPENFSTCWSVERQDVCLLRKHLSTRQSRGKDLKTTRKEKAFQFKSLSGPLTILCRCIVRKLRS